MTAVRRNQFTTNEVPIRILRYPTDTDPFCVVWKGGGVPSAPLHIGDECALSLAIHACTVFEQTGNMSGLRGVSSPSARKMYRDIDSAPSAELCLVHRLDTDAQGLLLMAATSAAYSALKTSQKEGHFKKIYRAQVECIPDNAAILGGFPPPPDIRRCASKTAGRGEETYGGFTITSRFRAWGHGRKEVRPVTADSGTKAQKTAAKTIYRTTVQDITSNIATISITAGFRHQVRCHLAWAGFPVAGDRLYNSNCRNIAEAKPVTPLQFECIALSFPHPLTDKIITIDNNCPVI